MALQGTDPESYITEYTLVYEDNDSCLGAEDLLRSYGWVIESTLDVPDKHRFLLSFALRFGENASDKSTLPLNGVRGCLGETLIPPA